MSNSTAPSMDTTSSETPFAGIAEGSKLPVLPLTNTVLFPFLALPLSVDEEESVRLVNDIVGGSRIAAFVLRKSGGTGGGSQAEAESGDPYHAIGCAGRVLKMLRLPDDTARILVQGIQRVAIRRVVQTEPYPVAEVAPLEDVVKETKATEALTRSVAEAFRQVTDLSPAMPEELKLAAANLRDPGRLADYVASSINVSAEKKQEILSAANVAERLRRLLQTLQRETEVLQLGAQIQDRVQQSFTKSQREFFLREQMRAIREELGEDDDREGEIHELRAKIKDANLSEEAAKAAEREVDRLGRMSPASAEYSVARTYIDWLVEMPWSVQTEDRIDVAASKKILDADHHALERVKDRILEYLSVLKLNRNIRGPILCFAGPPGVGKTSLGMSIARSLGRKFVRISLGGVRDEAEIRGHRRTYVGALPGRIIQGVRKAGTRNPVFMLDEIDKIGLDFRGDPGAALLEVLDPAQNSTFADHYLEVPFDLSRILFITTANQLEPIPPALLDRMEVLRLSGYTEQEKAVIASRFLLPRQVGEHGLKSAQVRIPKATILKIIRSYTREAGVRNLERELATVCRKIARAVAERKRAPARIDPDRLSRYLGPARFEYDVAERTSEPGIATGVAWTPAGGDILFIEATMMPGRGRMTLTGQLGDVMKESAMAALSYVRSRQKELGIGHDFDKLDLHIHVPAGAIPKDGPSAGVTIAVALVSLLTGRAVRPEVAMTGEITLRGKVLPVGGIKEKVLAAARAGLERLVMPQANRNDIAEVPAEIRRRMKFRFVDGIDGALRTALQPASHSRTKARNA